MLQELEIPAHDVPHKGFRFVLADPLCCPVLVEVLLEVAVLAELQDDVEVLPASEAVVHFDDEGRGDGFEGGDLTFDLLLNMVGQLIDVDDFDSHLLAVLALPEVDRPAGPLPQRPRLPNPVIRYLFDLRLLHNTIINLLLPPTYLTPNYPPHPHPPPAPALHD